MWKSSKNPLREESGFSLIELAIGLIVVGALTVGFFKGQHLVEGAKIQATADLFQDYKTAFSIFEERYGALPGDFSQADTFLGMAEEWNGDGDGIIGGAGLASSSDARKFWAHLSSAGLINLSLTPSQKEGRFGVNIPASPLGGGFTVVHAVVGNNEIINFGFLRGIWLVLGGCYQETGLAPLLTPYQAFRLGKKLGNVGLKSSSNVIYLNGLPGDNPKCFNEDGLLNLHYKGRACIVAVRLCNVRVGG